MASKMQLIVGAAAVALAWQMAAATPAGAAEQPSQASTWRPTRSAASRTCRTSPNIAAPSRSRSPISDGWGGNYWRQITRREFEDEAKKCPNITEVRYTDGEFKAEKQIADIQGLIAQKFDVIIVFADTGVAQLKVMRQATEAGIAVVPFTTGDAPFGDMGKDYLVRVTERQIELGKMLAEWMVKTLGGKGNVIVHGGTPGNPMTAVAGKSAGRKSSPRTRASKCSRVRSTPTGIRRWRRR